MITTVCAMCLELLLFGNGAIIAHWYETQTSTYIIQSFKPLIIVMFPNSSKNRRVSQIATDLFLNKKIATDLWMRIQRHYTKIRKFKTITGQFEPQAFLFFLISEKISSHLGNLDSSLSTSSHSPFVKHSSKYFMLKNWPDSFSNLHWTAHLHSLYIKHYSPLSFFFLNFLENQEKPKTTD